jgi:hypothetical protein
MKKGRKKPEGYLSGTQAMIIVLALMIFAGWLCATNSSYAGQVVIVACLCVVLLVGGPAALKYMKNRGIL